MQTLLGSPKQVTWANSIRLNFFIQFDNTAKKIVASMPSEQQAMMTKGIEIFKAIYLLEEKASWWIENRNLNFSSIDTFRNEFRLRCNIDSDLSDWMKELKAMKVAQTKPVVVTETPKPIVKEMTAEEKRLDILRWYN